MKDYTFFSYATNEALHLSERERETIIDCFRKIDDEINFGGDKHSNTIIASAIELFLNYCLRFYDRQFITRHKVNNEVVAKFERELRRYFDSGKCREGLPTVAYFAEKACLSPGYFGDLIRKELGISAKDVISSHMISIAKQRLASTDTDVSLIAYDLGFQYPQHFTRQFKRLTGQSPTEYRMASGR